MTSLFIITGTSRGLGAAISRTFATGSNDLLLLSRAPPSWEPVEGHAGEVMREACDVSNLDALEETFNGILSKISKKYQKVVFVHNAGTIGNVARCQDLNPSQDVAGMISLNVSSMIMLTTLFLRKFEADGTQCVVVNISSGAAVRAFDTWTLYCTAKAARYMFVQVLATENDPARVKALNYSPGILATQMQKDIQTMAGETSSTAKFLNDVISSGRAVPIDETCKELKAILDADEWTSGEQIDFYSRRPEYSP